MRLRTEVAMPEQGVATDPYAIQYSESGKTSQKNLPPQATVLLYDVLDKLAANPDGSPGRVRVISQDGRVRLYSHPSPALQVTYEVDAARRVLYLLHFVAPKLQGTKRVFISYSHQDAKWLEKLRQFLKPLEEQELIRIWDDTEIQPGAEWFDEIRKALEAAQVAVFLVSQNFLVSQFVREKELPILVEAAAIRGCKMFWIAVSSSTVEDSPLARFQAAISSPLDLMSEPEQNKELAEVYRKMKRIVTAQ
jgi:hypothetical protein